MFVTFDPTAYIVTEEVDKYAKLNLFRSGDLSGDTEIIVTYQSGTAIGKCYNNKLNDSSVLLSCTPHNFPVAGLDFTPSPTMVIFSSGQSSAEMEVPINNDFTYEETEMFTVKLTTNDLNVMFGDDSASVTILDNGN